MSGRRVSRRCAAGGLGMLLLAATAAGSAKAEELDGELLARCAEFQAQEDELNRIFDVIGDLSMREREGVDRIHELRGLISDLPARTPEGLRAKAQIALLDFGPEDKWPEDNSQWTAWSLARDVLGKDL
jgi:hypothetical protein